MRIVAALITLGALQLSAAAELEPASDIALRDIVVDDPGRCAELAEGLGLRQATLDAERSRLDTEIRTGIGELAADFDALADQDFDDNDLRSRRLQLNRKIETYAKLQPEQQEIRRTSYKDILQQSRDYREKLAAAMGRKVTHINAGIQAHDALTDVSAAATNLKSRVVELLGTIEAIKLSPAQQKGRVNGIYKDTLREIGAVMEKLGMARENQIAHLNTRIEAYNTQSVAFEAEVSRYRTICTGWMAGRP